MQILPPIAWMTYASVSEDNSPSEYSSHSDDVNFRTAKRQKSLGIDSDKESENETQGAGEDFTGVWGIHIECNNLQSVTDITDFLAS